MHAEAVLLVDDGETQARERDAFLQQCVGAHGQQRFTGAQAFLVGASFAHTGATRDQLQPHARRLEPAGA